MIIYSGIQPLFNGNVRVFDLEIVRKLGIAHLFMQ